ncbi:MAG: hypothetical protein SGI99_10310 [Pseudomonadota bacterium]|nr:hypothetical protein [Pseudomonadota bacterium]
MFKTRSCILWIVTGLAAAFAAGNAKADYLPAMPATLQLRVENTTSYAQTGYVVRSGMPLSQAQARLTTTGFAIVDDVGLPVPAQFRVLARWNAGLNATSAPIQWVLASFPATVAANSTRNYRLIIDGSVANPAPALTLNIQSDAGSFTVDTGVGTFDVPRNGTRLFNLARSGEGDTTVVGGSFEVVVGGVSRTAIFDVRSAEIDQQDALSAVIVVAAEIDMPEVGGGRLGLTRRYTFRAGSTVVHVRSWLDWEGDLCGDGQIVCAGQPNGLRIDRWRERLTTFLGTGTSVSLLGDAESAITSGPLTLGQTAHLRQLRRNDRTAPAQFEQRLPSGALQTGGFADGGVLVANGSEGLLAVALKEMDHFEPQALRVLSDNSVVIDLIDNGVWLGLRQGVYVEYAIAPNPPATTVQNGIADIWPDLNAPLLALPSAAWVAATRAIDEIPVGVLAAPWDRYDGIVNAALDRTIELRLDRGLYGLMTYGLFPRLWGDPVNSEEIDCGVGNDPTPADDWDDTYWCTTWTDYHNASSNAVYAALRHSDARRLHELSFPAALRMLHTQIYQCGPNDNTFRCGMAPAGYNGYRSDNNSSHQYFDNLFLYYWLTGDDTVWRTVQRGTSGFRAYLCPSRGNVPLGPVCAPNAPITDADARLNGRVTGQFYEAFRFVGLASGDASYLDDWTSNTARMLTQNFAEVTRNSVAIGLIEPSGGADLSIITGPGTYYSDQLWMNALYDLTSLQRMQVQTQDQAIAAVPPLTPSRVQTGFAQTARAATQISSGNGSVNGIIPEWLRFTFTGARIGGTATALEPGWTPNPAPAPGQCLDLCLYDEGKAAMSAVVMRGADSSNDPALRSFGIALTNLGLDARVASPQPLNKTTGIGLTKLHAAVARITAPVQVVVLFGSGFE